MSKEIFPAKEIASEVLRWRYLISIGKKDEALELLESILILVTPMIERLAQHEGFNNTVPLDALRSAAHVKVIKWMEGWDQSKSIFTWFSKCARNVFLSEVTKETQRNERYYSVGDSLEKYFGTEDHTSDRDDFEDEISSKIKDFVCRWGSEQEKDAIKYIIECILEQSYNKTRIIKGVSCAYGVGQELAKHLYWWAVVSIRDINYSRVRNTYTDVDLIYSWLSYNPVIELLDYMSFDNFKKFIVVYGGTKMKIPTLAQVDKIHACRAMVEELDRTEMTPDDISKVACKYKKSSKYVMDAYESMMTLYSNKRIGEHSLYE